MTRFLKSIFRKSSTNEPTPEELEALARANIALRARIERLTARQAA